MACGRFVVRRGVARGLAAALFLAGSLSALERAHACSIGANEHRQDDAEKAVDMTAPGKPTVGAVTIKRGRGPTQVGCSSSSSSCDDMGSIGVVVSATDDRTPPTAMGYRVTVNRGKAPDLYFPGIDVRAYGDQIWLFWFDGASDDQESLDFDLEVRAVDMAGNVSADFAAVSVRQDTGGCSVGRGSRTTGDGLGVALAGLVAWAMARRRRTMLRRRED